MEFITTLLAPYWQPIAGVIAAAMTGLVIAATAYFKGRSTERRKMETEDLRDADQIRKIGADARDRVDTSAAGLRQDDGYKRD